MKNQKLPTFVLALALASCGESPSRPASGLSDESTSSGGRQADSGAGGEENGDGDDSQGPNQGIKCGAMTCTVGTCNMEGGAPVCACPAGFGPAEDGCPDVNECEQFGVCPGGICRNTPGRHYCECDEGLAWDGDACLDVNECEFDPCAPEAQCENTHGAFECTCPQGTSGNGLFCKETPDCAADTCGPTGTCVETPSGHACQCSLGRAGSDDCSTVCDELTLDPILETLIRDLVGLPLEAGPLRALHVEGIVSLDASMRDVKTLDGLECLPELEALDLRGTSLGTEPGSFPEPLAAVASLNRLRSLNLGCTAVSNLNGLEDHPALEELLINQESPGCSSSLAALAPLVGLSRLSTLDLAGNLVSDFPAASAMHSLRSLLLGANELHLVEPLADLRLLERLTLYHNDLSDLSPLANLSLLRYLDVAENSVDSLDALSDLEHLEVLQVRDNELTTLGDLSGLSSLVSLDASLNQLTNLQAIAGLPRLSSLTVVGNQISSLTPLLVAGFVGTLSVSGNPLMCESEAPNFVALVSQGVHVFGQCQMD